METLQPNYLFLILVEGGGIVSVFGRLQVETLETYTKKLATSGKMTSAQSWEKEISFVLLQLTNGLKSLQAQGIEEVNGNSLEHFLLIRADKDPQYRIIILDDVVPKFWTNSVESATETFDLTQNSDKRYANEFDLTQKAEKRFEKFQ